MKNQLPVFMLFLALSLSTASSFAQIDTAYLNFDSCAVNTIQSNLPATTQANAENFAALTWSHDSVPYVMRTMMTLYPGQLPDNAHILDARISLYADTTSQLGFPNHPTYGANNRGKIRRVTEYWNLDNVSWNTQPQTTKINQAFLPPSTYDTQNYLEVNITAMIQDMIDNPSTAHGIMIQLSDEQNFYKSLIFGSCKHPNSNIQPRVMVVYSTGDTLKQSHAPVLPGWDVEIIPSIASSGISYLFSDYTEGEFASLSVFNVSGQMVSSETIKLQPSHLADVSELAPGMYFYRVENQSTMKVSTGKFIKN